MREEGGKRTSPTSLVISIAQVLTLVKDVFTYGEVQIGSTHNLPNTNAIHPNAQHPEASHKKDEQP